MTDEREQANEKVATTMTKGWGTSRIGIVAAAALVVGASAGYIGAHATMSPPPERHVMAPMPGTEGHAGTDHGKSHGSPGPSDGGPFAEVNARMHDAMNVPPSGDVDLDFARGMVPHHEGAVEMARIELREGKDPEMRRLAEQVVSSQKAEIATMKAWIAKREPSR